MIPNFPRLFNLFWLYITQPICIPMYQVFLYLFVFFVLSLKVLNHYLLKITFVQTLNSKKGNLKKAKLGFKQKQQGNNSMMDFDSLSSTYILTFQTQDSNQLAIRKHKIEKSIISLESDSEFTDFLKGHVNLELNDIENHQDKLGMINQTFLDKFNLSINDVILIKRANSRTFEINYTAEGYRKIAVSEFRGNQQKVLQIENMKSDPLEIHYSNRKFISSFDNISILGSGSFGIVS